MLPQVLPRTSGLLDPYDVVDDVLARLDVADAAAVLAVLAGPDPDDPWSRVGHPPVRPGPARDCTGATDPDNHAAALHMVTMQGGVFGCVSDSTSVIEATTREEL